MFDAVVYIGHGSRCEEGEAQFKRFIESVKEEVASPNQEIAFLELIAPTIAETMKKLIADGAKRFLIVPVLLFQQFNTNWIFRRSCVRFKGNIPLFRLKSRSRLERIHIWLILW